MIKKPNKKLFLMSFLSALGTVILFISMGCTNHSDSPADENAGGKEEQEEGQVQGQEQEQEPVKLDLSYLPMGSGSTTPFMKGTFIDFWYKSGWSSTDWENQMKEMQELGIKTLIVQFTAYESTIWAKSQNTYSTAAYPDALPLLLEAAAKYYMGVYVGLYFSENYWENTTNLNILKTHVQRCKDLAKDIWAVNKDKESFKGWYIPQEPAAYYYHTPSDLAILKNQLINPIAGYCKSFSGKPVAISAFFNYNLTNIDVFSEFIKGLGSTNIELIILQDGIGVNHCDLASLESYYSAAHEALYKNGEFKGAFWADIETFNDQIPESMSVIAQKFAAVKEHVSFIVTFQYYSDMCPTGPNKNLAKTLRDDYLDYLK